MRRWSIAPVLVVAACTFAVLSYLDGWLALPLRELSSILAEGVLALIGYPVTRTGTILATPNFTFDVVPACSGSATLRVLMALAVLWCGSHPGLTPVRRLAALALAVPLALAANGLRVAALVAIGDALLRPVEGWPHEVIGLATFALALGGLFLVTEGLTTSAAPRPAPRWVRPVGLVVLLVVLAAPVLLWCATAWAHSPLDRFGWVLVLAGALGLGWAWRSTTVAPMPRVGASVVVAALLVTVAGVVVEVFAVQAIGLMTLLLGMAWWCHGVGVVRRGWPWLVLVGLGLPTVGFLLTRVIGWQGELASVVVRGVFGAGMVVMGWWVGGGGRRSLGELELVSPRGQLRPLGELELASPRTSGVVWPLSLVALVALAVAGQTLLATNRDSGRLLAVHTAYLQGEWTGQDLAVDASTLAILGRDHVHLRTYHDGGGARVDLIMTTTGGDRHRAHPPEYCLTGAGWVIAARSSGTILLGDGTSVPVSRLSLSKGATTTALTFWYTDGSTVLDGFRAMLTEDTLRRLGGQRTDWALIRVVGEAKNVERFLAQFQPGVDG